MNKNLPLDLEDEETLRDIQEYIEFKRNKAKLNSASTPETATRKHRDTNPHNRVTQNKESISKESLGDRSATFAGKRTGNKNIIYNTKDLVVSDRAKEVLKHAIPKGVIRGYIRVSTIKQVDKESLGTQIELISAYADKKGWQCQIYEDRGISGAADMSKRLGLRRCIEDLQVGDELVVKDQSRLSRDKNYYFKLKSDIESRGAVFTCLDNLDDKDGIRELMNAYLMQREREEISNRVKITLRTLQAQGGYRGKPPYGWKFVSKDKPFIKDEQEQAVIEYMRVTKEEFPDITVSQMCEMLERAHIRIRKCKAVYPARVREIMIQNDIIDGNAKRTDIKQIHEAYRAYLELEKLNKEQASEKGIVDDVGSDSESE